MKLIIPLATFGLILGLVVAGLSILGYIDIMQMHYLRLQSEIENVRSSLAACEEELFVCRENGYSPYSQ